MEVQKEEPMRREFADQPEEVMWLTLCFGYVFDLSQHPDQSSGHPHFHGDH